MVKEELRSFLLFFQFSLKMKGLIPRLTCLVQDKQATIIMLREV